MCPGRSIIGAQSSIIAYKHCLLLISIQEQKEKEKMHSSRSLLQWGTPAQQGFRPAFNKTCAQTSVCVTTAHTGRRQQQQCHHRQQLQQQQSARRSLAPVASFFQDQFQDEEQEQPQPPSDQAVQQQQPAVDTAAADWVFQHPSGVQVCVFGVEHLERQPHIGVFALMLGETAVVALCLCWGTLHLCSAQKVRWRQTNLLPPTAVGAGCSTAGNWVLQNRPAAVVVETACTPEHGSAPGRGVTCRDQVQGAFFIVVVTCNHCAETDGFA